MGGNQRTEVGDEESDQRIGKFSLTSPERLQTLVQSGARLAANPGGLPDQVLRYISP